MFRYRDANREDFLIIAAFPQSREELFYMYPKARFPLTAEQLEEAAANRFSPTVMTYDGVIAGYANLYDVHEGTECWLGNVIVHPEFRGKGAGSFLLETMKTRALKEYRAQELKLICHNTNTRALLFYHRQGFKPFDLKPMEDFRGNRIAGIQMSIRLETKEQPNA